MPALYYTVVILLRDTREECELTLWNLDTCVGHSAGLKRLSGASYVTELPQKFSKQIKNKSRQNYSYMSIPLEEGFALTCPIN